MMIALPAGSAPLLGLEWKGVIEKLMSEPAFESAPAQTPPPGASACCSGGSSCAPKTLPTASPTTADSGLPKSVSACLLHAQTRPCMRGVTGARARGGFPSAAGGGRGGGARMNAGGGALCNSFPRSHVRSLHPATPRARVTAPGLSLAHVVRINA